MTKQRTVEIVKARELAADLRKNAGGIIGYLRGVYDRAQSAACESDTYKALVAHCHQENAEHLAHREAIRAVREALLGYGYIDLAFPMGAIDLAYTEIT